MAEDCLFADGFDEALIGVGRQFNKTLAIYDYAKCLQILCREMSFEEAAEYMEVNVVGAWVGDLTPVFVNKMDRAQIEEYLVG